MLDMSRVPVKSKQPPPPRALKLPTISAAAMQALANRATMVSVDEVVFPHAPPVDGARGQPRYPPLSPAAYLRGVTAIATYRAYFFPGAAIQWLSYVLWLQGAYGTIAWLNGVLRRYAPSDAGRLTTHSLRIGFATAAAATGASDGAIRASGRWASSSHIRYIRGRRLDVWEARIAVNAAPAP
ncbi:hypothetical protein FJT64_021862 [Amphibalanus amphitrite]|uniref:Uncharacterized protein n=1 Tax=Amphibalanus amphitrite TaxID=1232801 RepID=A0A6A4WKQ1_AMPAM|nr:hypothetical protein FJT64_021862 [Amphibalanus amphitrite]